MSAAHGVRARLPWIVAAVLVVVVALLALGLARVWTVSDRTRSARDAQRYSLTATERDARLAAVTEAANLLSFTRAHFNSDFNRALAGATGGVRSDLESKRADLLKALTATKADAVGKVLASAYAGTDGSKVLILVTLSNYRATAAGAQASTATVQRFQLAMVQRDDKWLAAGLNSIGIS